MNKLKIAVVGVGSISACHIDSYRKMDDVEVYAFCDINEVQLKKQGQKYGVTRLYTDEAQMLRELPEIDAVSVCTWNSAHAPCAIMALNAGKHVLCEKPMATTVEDALAMEEAAKRNNRVLMIGFVRRFGRDCVVAKDLIDSGEAGEMYYAKAQYVRRNGNPGGWFGNTAFSGGGPLIDLGVHVIDLVRYLVGKPHAVSVYGATFRKLGNRPGIKETVDYQSVSASKENDICDCEDLATALIRFDNGVVLHVEASFTLNSHNVGCVQVFGTKAGLSIEKNLTVCSDMGGYLSNVEFVGKTGLNVDEAFSAEIRHFVACARGEATCLNPAEDGVELMKILTAIYRSAKTGHEELI